MKKSNVGCFGLLAVALVVSWIIQFFQSGVGQALLVIGLGGGLIFLVVRYLLKSDSGPKYLDTLAVQKQAIQVIANQLEGGQQISNYSGLNLKAGEVFIGSIPAELIESRSNGSSYVGGSQGFSFRVMKGVSYRVGATRGQLVKNPETVQMISSGTASYTNKRVVFAGATASREWSFEKLINVDVGPNGHTTMISVSNRQKPSGLQAANPTSITPGTMLSLALEYNDGGAPKALRMANEFIDALTQVINGATSVDVGAPRHESEPAEPAAAPAPAKAIQTPAQASNTPAPASNGAPRLAIGDEFEVVGESFNAANFAAIRKTLGAAVGQTVDTDVVLQAEPFNKFSKNGNAVAVTVNGLTLGHIAEDSNTAFFNLLKEHNGSLPCAAEIYFAPDGPVVKNSVRLLCEYPPRIA